MTFGGRVESADDDPSGDASSDASAQSLLAREVVVAAAGVPKSQRYSGSYPPWWNDRASLPDAQPIFIHIPKTGGVSVEDTASRAGHVTGACVVHSFGDAALPYALAPGFEMEPYHAPPARFVPYSFTIVRSPYARMVSEFNWMALSDPAKAADIKAGRWSFTCGEFQDFVRAWTPRGVRCSGLARRLNEADYDGASRRTRETSTTRTLCLSGSWRRTRESSTHSRRGVAFLRRRRSPILPAREINAGLVSETASQCWASCPGACWTVRRTPPWISRLMTRELARRRSAALAKKRGTCQRHRKLSRGTRPVRDRRGTRRLPRRRARGTRGTEEAADDAARRNLRPRHGSIPFLLDASEEAGTTAPTCVERDRLVALGHREDPGQARVRGPAAWARRRGAGARCLTRGRRGDVQIADGRTRRSRRTRWAVSGARMDSWR